MLSQEVPVWNSEDGPYDREILNRTEGGVYVFVSLTKGMTEG